MPRVIVKERFGYVQSTPASIWTITHNLNVTSPVVAVWTKESETSPLVAEEAASISYATPNLITITFGGRIVSGQVLIT